MTTPRPDDLHDPRFDDAWRRASREDPPAALDDAIRAAARREVGARPQDVTKVPEATSPERWWYPLAAAATIGAIAIGLLQLSSREHVGSADEPRIVSDTPAGANNAPASSSPPGKVQAQAPVSAEAAKPDTEAKRMQAAPAQRAQTSAVPDSLAPSEPAAGVDMKRRQAAEPQPFPAGKRDDARSVAQSARSAAAAQKNEAAPQAPPVAPPTPIEKKTESVPEAAPAAPAAPIAKKPETARDALGESPAPFAKKSETTRGAPPVAPAAPPAGRVASESASAPGAAVRSGLAASAPAQNDARSSANVAGTVAPAAPAASAAPAPTVATPPAPREEAAATAPPAAAPAGRPPLATPQRAAAKLAADRGDSASIAERAKERAALTVTEWIALMRRLRDERRYDELAKELAAFRSLHADANTLLPPDLRDAGMPAR